MLCSVMSHAMIGMEMMRNRLMMFGMVNTTSRGSGLYFFRLNFSLRSMGVTSKRLTFASPGWR